MAKKKEMQQLAAVIFDMDGVLVDTEPLWRICMIKGFTAAGIEFTDEDCKSTTGMRFDEVVKHWHKKKSFNKKTPQELHDNVIDDLCAMILAEEVEMQGVEIAIEVCKAHNLKLGLATSSNNKIIETVIKKINGHHFFDAIESAEGLDYGKPHPLVFLNCANKLNVIAQHCLVIEDSINGVIAGKAAGMNVIAVPDALHFEDARFSIADHKMKSLLEFPSFIKNQIKQIQL